VSDVSGAQVLEAIGEATKDLRAKLATAQARIAELEAALRKLMTCAADYDATVGDFMDEACPDTEHPMQCARVRLMAALGVKP
jgi:hypothetical protein